ncbi:hypothetical protein RI367_004433 [Sorochytrium milnesiophthora]
MLQARVSPSDTIDRLVSDYCDNDDDSDRRGANAPSQKPTIAQQPPALCNSFPPLASWQKQPLFMQGRVEQQAQVVDILHAPLPTPIPPTPTVEHQHAARFERPPPLVIVPPPSSRPQSEHGDVIEDDQAAHPGGCLLKRREHYRTSRHTRPESILTPTVSPTASVQQQQQQLGSATLSTERAVRHTIPHLLKDLCLLSSAAAILRSECPPCAVCSKSVKLHGVYCKYCGIVLHRDCSAKITKSDELFYCGLPQEFYSILSEQQQQSKTLDAAHHGLTVYISPHLVGVHTPPSPSSPSSPHSAGTSGSNSFVLHEPRFATAQQPLLPSAVAAHANHPVLVQSPPPVTPANDINPLALDSDTLQVMCDAASRAHTTRRSRTESVVSRHSPLVASPYAETLFLPSASDDAMSPARFELLDIGDLVISPDTECSVPTDANDSDSTLTITSYQTYDATAAETKESIVSDSPSQHQHALTAPTVICQPAPSSAKSDWTTDDYVVVPMSEVHVHQQVGAGSFGTVYRCTWLGIDVALKRLKHTVPTTPMVRTLVREQTLRRSRTKGLHDHGQIGDEAKERSCLPLPAPLYEELKILRRLRHPHIVLFMAFAVEDEEMLGHAPADSLSAANGLGIVTQFCSHGSLYDFLHGQPKVGTVTPSYGPTQMCEWTLQISLGLEFLHARGVVHCDLKSPNVLLDSEMSVKLADFGLSKIVNAEGLAMRENSLGSIYWLAPEIVRRQDSACSNTIDIWALGMIMYELATRKLPYHPLNTPEAILFRIGSSKLPDMQYIQPSTAKPYTDLLLMCLASDPAQRCTAQGAAERLQQLVKAAKRRLEKTKSFDPRLLSRQQQV